MHSPEELQNSIDNISKTVFMLEYEKWVIASEVGIVAADRIQQVIDDCYERIQELNAQIQLGDIRG
jgi:hypothetical protein